MMASAKIESCSRAPPEKTLKSENIDAEGMVLDGRPDELIVAVAKERNSYNFV